MRERTNKRKKVKDVESSSMGEKTEVEAQKSTKVLGKRVSRTPGPLPTRAPKNKKNLRKKRF